MTDPLSLEGLNRASVLVALYNAATPAGMPYTSYNPTPLTLGQAQLILARSTYVSVVGERVFQCDFAHERLYARHYDAAYGPGLAVEVLARLRGEEELRHGSG